MQKPMNVQRRLVALGLPGVLAAVAMGGWAAGMPSIQERARAAVKEGRAGLISRIERLERAGDPRRTSSYQLWATDGLRDECLAIIRDARPPISKETQLRLYKAEAQRRVVRGHYSAAYQALVEAKAKGLAEGKAGAALARRVEELKWLADTWRPGWDAHAAGNLAATVDATRKMMQRYPKDCGDLLYRMEAAHYRKQGKDDKAQDAWRRQKTALKGTFWEGQAARNIASHYRHRAEYAKALAEYQTCLAAYGDAEDRGTIHRDMAECYIGLKKGTEALRELKLAQKALPYVPPALTQKQKQTLVDLEAKAKKLM